MKIDRARIFSWIKQAVILIAVLYGIHLWQTKDLLDSESEAPDFVLTSLQGENIRLSESKGKVTVLYFMAPWCSVCKASFSNLVDLRADRGRSEFDIFAVVLDYNSRAEVNEFVKGRDLNFPMLMGDSRVARDYNIQGFPTIYILDREGRVESKMVGYTTELGLKLRTM